MVLHGIDLTPTQRRLFDLLSDGGMYTRKQVVAHLCNGDRIEESAVPYHISTLRAAISPCGLMIVYHNRGRRESLYQLVRRVTSGD